MNWSLHYERLIEKRRKEKPEGYTESHHIHPRCQGGPDISENLIRLTAGEHLLAHLLLVKMNPGSKVLLSAANMMSNFRKYGCRKYSWLRERWAKVMSEKFKGITLTKEHCKKMSDSTKGIAKPLGFGKKISEALTGISQSKEHRQKNSESQKKSSKAKKHLKRLHDSNIGRKIGPRSEECKNKISEILKKSPKTAAHTKKLGESRKGISTGKVWIFNEHLKLSKLILKEEVIQNLSEGWKAGRKYKRSWWKEID